MNEPDLSKIHDRGDLKWKTSFMLPEHVKRIQEWYRDQDRKTKPEFDEQYLNELATRVGEAKHEQYTVIVRIFDEFDDIRITGRITVIDKQLRRIRIDNDGLVWVYFDDILSIEKHL